ncbi:carbon storage regulator [Cerasibacillus quisquiliarum]|uniref:Translational regulator CsrA n=1 Tax=Cerasibacillus quisquiliarum TaxID=227865 RepID=A0A511UVF9_9BACI|nr:carbon storage regulator CsrA [Cerasibacillus quisquiliarum]MBB5145199.1 carbon storage regulator [Cerasibacillus quisquiliarum]GEN29911.1 carbon storage regulator [Cerasibacillus quisquiliarum]
MLVLTRKKNESILIGEEIEIKILSIDGDQIKLGVNAPSEVDIYRKELYEDIQKENNQAAMISIDVLELLQQNDKK